MLLVSAAVVACLGVVQVCAIYPSPTPTSHTHLLTSQPAGNCSGIYISQRGDCHAGSRLATNKEVSSCLPVICDTMDVWSKAAYANTSMMIVGSGYDATCGPLTKAGDLEDTVCAWSSVPTPKPTPPTPTPMPTPAGNCSETLYISQRGDCPYAGSRLATNKEVSSCLPVICDMLPTWSKAAYADTSMMIVGSGYNATCGPLTKDGYLGDAVCASSSVPTLAFVRKTSPEK